MQTRGFRLTLLTLLVGTAIVGGLVVWSAQQRIAALNSLEQDEAARVARIAELTAALGSAQLAYSASPQISDGWFGHISRLVETVETQTASLWEKSSHSDEPPPQLRALLNAVSVVVRTTARAKENLTAGSDLMAADLVLAEARQGVEAMAGSLQNLQSAQRAAVARQRAALERRSWTVVGAVAGLWTLGLLTLVLPRSPQAAPAPRVETLRIAPYPEPRAQAAPERPAMDLSGAAELCTAISRATSANDVPSLLARIATLLDASGIILWIKTGGDALTAIASHGYEVTLINRISPIPLSVHNLTTAAWHAGAIRTVPSGETSNAALAAPLWGPEGCLGVLAAEMCRREEPDSSVTSLAMIVAAQFATIIAPPSANDRPDGFMGSGLGESDLPLKVAGV